MKLRMATHFARMQQLDEFPSLQRNSPFKRYHEENVYNVYLHHNVYSQKSYVSTHYAVSTYLIPMSEHIML